MADEQVDEEVTEEVAIVDELDPAPAEKSGFGLGSVAEGSDDPIIEQPVDEWLQGLSLIHISEPTSPY